LSVPVVTYKGDTDQNDMDDIFADSPTEVGRISGHTTSLTRVDMR